MPNEELSKYMKKGNETEYMRNYMRSKRSKDLGMRIHWNKHNFKKNRDVKDYFCEKFDRTCQVCGFQFGNECFDFHHIDPKTKDFNIAASYCMKKKEQIEEELKKCIMVCSNCHRTIHKNQTDESDINIDKVMKKSKGAKK